MEIVILGITILIIIYVGMPLIRTSSQKLSFFQPFIPDQKFQMEEKKRAIYSALKELEFDFKMGKLTEEDYCKLKSRYEKEAIDVLKQLDGSPSSIESLEEKVEKEISIYLEEEREKVQKNFCPNCGSKVRIQDSFCSNCGTKLRRENS